MVSKSIEKIDVIPSAARAVTLAAEVGAQGDSSAEAVGLIVSTDMAPVPELELDPETLRACGFEGKPGQAFVVAKATGPIMVAVGGGPADRFDHVALRNAAAAFARAVPRQGQLAIAVPDGIAAPADEAAQALVEGCLLARYSFNLKSQSDDVVPIESLTLLTSDELQAETQRGLDRGAIFAAAAALSRDLATCPPGILTATRIGETAVEVGERSGLMVEIFDRAALIEMGCGGLLGVNLGSVEEPRMIKLSYPGTGGGNLTLVGKGIMYDSGGISLKPSDAVHATMKNDMSGAGAILAAMSALQALDCPTAVTGYLMCTDNMPSGSALKLGDVITMRDGTTVEVLNSDAEGRLVMADALALAAEEPTDSIVDIATLTGATMRALGVEIAGVFGNNQALIEQVKAAAEGTDEQVWQFPLATRYRGELDSPIADMTNMGGPNAGGITAALFLAEFVQDIPWAHIDIAGTSQADQAKDWRTKGPTGFGARLLIDLALDFQA